MFAPERRSARKVAISPTSYLIRCGGQLRTAKNQDVLKDKSSPSQRPSPAWPTSSASENRASPRCDGGADIARGCNSYGCLAREIDDGTDHWISVWTRGLCRVPRNVPLRRRLRFRRGGTQDHRQRAGCAGGAGADHQYPADVAVRGLAQRDGAEAVQALVDAIHPS